MSSSDRGHFAVRVRASHPRIRSRKTLIPKKTADFGPSTLAFVRLTNHAKHVSSLLVAHFDTIMHLRCFTCEKYQFLIYNFLLSMDLFIFPSMCVSFSQPHATLIQRIWPNCEVISFSILIEIWNARLPLGPQIVALGQRRVRRDDGGAHRHFKRSSIFLRTTHTRTQYHRPREARNNQGGSKVDYLNSELSSFIWCAQNFGIFWPPRPLSLT